MSEPKRAEEWTLDGKPLTAAERLLVALVGSNSLTNGKTILLLSPDEVEDYHRILSAHDPLCKAVEELVSQFVADRAVCGGVPKKTIDAVPVVVQSRAALALANPPAPTPHRGRPYEWHPACVVIDDPVKPVPGKVE